MAMCSSYRLCLSAAFLHPPKMVLNLNCFTSFLMRLWNQYIFQCFRAVYSKFDSDWRLNSSSQRLCALVTSLIALNIFSIRLWVLTSRYRCTAILLLTLFSLYSRYSLMCRKCSNRVECRTRRFNAASLRTWEICCTSYRASILMLTSTFLSTN